MSHRTYGSGFRCGHSALGGGGAKPFALPGDEPQYFRARPFALISLRVELQLDWDARSVEGDAELVLERLDREARWAEIDAIGFEDLVVERPANGGWAPAAFRYDEEVLRVDLSDVGAGDKGKVRVRYRATPARGLYFVGPDEANPGRPRQVWTQCQDQDGRHWFPCQDHPGQRMRTDFAVTVPKGMFALGKRLARRAHGARGRRALPLAAGGAAPGVPRDPGGRRVRSDRDRGGRRPRRLLRARRSRGGRRAVARDDPGHDSGSSPTSSARRSRGRSTRRSS